MSSRLRIVEKRIETNNQEARRKDNPVLCKGTNFNAGKKSLFEIVALNEAKLLDLLEYSRF